MGAYEYCRKLDMYRRDAIIEHFYLQEQCILSHALPIYKWDAENMTVRVYYDDYVQGMLDKINKDRRDYIESHYPELINEII